MKATDVLMEEHRVIERVLTTLETAAQRLEQGNAVRPGIFIDATEFIKGFADGCHHKKEEGVLFPMANQVIPPEQQDQVAMDFEKVEHEETGEGVHEKYLALAESLEKEVASL